MMQNNNVNIKYKYNRLELILLSGSKYDLMDFQPYKDKNLYIVDSCKFIIYNKNPTETQKMKFIENIVMNKIIISDKNKGFSDDQGFFDDFGFDDYTIHGRDIILFSLLHVKTGEEHIAIPFIAYEDCDKKEEFGYLRDGTILNVNDTKKYMDIQLEKERIKNLESIATTTYPPSGGLFGGFNMLTFISDYFGSPKTIKEVEDKFRELAKIHHPDIGGDELLFKAISNTRKYLVDEIKHKMGFSAYLAPKNVILGV